MYKNDIYLHGTRPNFSHLPISEFPPISGNALLALSEASTKQIPPSGALFSFTLEKMKIALFAAIVGIAIAADAEVAVAEVAATVVAAPRRHRVGRIPHRSLYSSSSSSGSSSSSDDKPRRHRRRHRHCTDSTYRLDSTTELVSNSGSFRFSSSSSSSTAEVVPAPQSPIVDPNVVVIDIVEDTTIDADAAPVVAQNAEFKRAFVQEMAHLKNAVQDVSAEGFWVN